MALTTSQKELEQYYANLSAKEGHYKGMSKTVFRKELMKAFYAFAETKGFTLEITKVKQQGLNMIFPWQKEFMELMLESIFMQKSMEIDISVLRQVGKSEGTALVIGFLISGAFFEHFKNPIVIAVIAPTKEKAKVIFRRAYKYIDHKDLKIDRADLKVSLRGDRLILFGIYEEDKGDVIEGETFDMIVRDEAHLGNDRKFIDQALPAITSKRGPVVQIGNGGYKECYFKDSIKAETHIYEGGKEKHLVKWTYHEARPILEYFAKSLKVNSCQTRITNIDADIRRHGINSHYVKKNYLCEWLEGHINVVSKQDLEACQAIIDTDKRQNLYVGLDIAMTHDRTVATIINEDKEIIDWIVCKDADESKSAFEQTDYLRNQCDVRGYTENIIAIAFDASGQSQGIMTEILDKKFFCDLVPYVFTNKGKHEWYSMAIESILTGSTEDRIKYNPLHEWADTFVKEWIKLEKKEPKQSSSFPIYNAPNLLNHFDDFCASFALAVHIRSQYTDNFSTIKYQSRFKPEQQQKKKPSRYHKANFSAAISKYF